MAASILVAMIIVVAVAAVNVLHCRVTASGPMRR
jgi:hypothetical protein